MFLDRMVVIKGLNLKKVKIALIYDFDGTLAPGNMQEHDFFPSLNIKPEDFWKETKKSAKKHNMNEILAYMELTIKKAQSEGANISKLKFENYGKNINFFTGVIDWFKLINNYSEEVKIEHYIISSGFEEMIKSSKIAKNFKYIFASSFKFDNNEVPCWPRVALDYTAKTQYLFRINKGIFNIYDNSEINEYVKEDDRYMPFSNMIYFGDGDTDIPAMKMVQYQGGYSIAVYPSEGASSRKKLENCKRLVEDKRANFMVPADYQKDSKLHKLTTIIIDKIVADNKLKNYK